MAVTTVKGAVLDLDIAQYTTAETGGQSRSIQSKFEELVSVLDYGATGDGTTDDTAAIQAAIDTGKSIFFPPGDYACASSLDMNTSGQQLRGAGKTITQIKFTGTGNFIVLNNFVDRYGFFNFTLRATQDDCKLIVYTGGNSYGTYINVEFIKDFDTGTLSFGIWGSGQASFSILMDFYGCRWQAFFTGVFLQGTAPANAFTEFSFTSCEFNGCRHGIFDDQDDDTAGAFRVVNSDFDAPNDGRNQIASLNGIGCSILGTRFETKQPDWDVFIPGDYTTLNPIHFGPDARRNVVFGAEAIPSTSGKIILHEGSRYTYVAGSDDTRIFGRTGINAIPDSDAALQIGRDEQLIRFKTSDGALQADIFMDTMGGDAGRLRLNSRDNIINFQVAGADVIAVGGASVFPNTDNVVELGAASLRFSRTFSREFYPGDGTVRWLAGSGTPEGAITAVVGSMWLRTDGGAGTVLYIKESGAGNTGWIPK